jgi:tetratricopeptide (TPR) repeat protein
MIDQVMMLATINSVFYSRALRRRHPPVFTFLLLFGFYNLAPHVNAQTQAPTDLRERPARIFQEAQVRYQRETNQTEASWHFSRACFDWAEFATNHTQRAEIAVLGITAGHQAVARDPKLAAGHYYLAMNLGQLAQTKKLGALKIVDEMEREFKAARGFDAGFDFAGPERGLGLLYLDAPGWPMSVGNRNKARQHLQKAVELSPDFPDNRLSLLEAYLKWGEKQNVQSQLEVVEKVLAAACKKLTGEAWTTSWEDWDRRWEKIKSKMSESEKSVQSPKSK